MSDNEQMYQRLLRVWNKKPALSRHPVIHPRPNGPWTKIVSALGAQWMTTRSIAAIAGKTPQAVIWHLQQHRRELDMRKGFGRAEWKLK